MLETVPDQLLDVGPGAAELARIADQVVQAVVGEHDAELGIEYDDPLGDVAEHRFEVLGPLRQLAAEPRLAVRPGRRRRLLASDAHRRCIVHRPTTFEVPHRSILARSAAVRTNDAAETLRVAWFSPRADR